LPRWMNNNRKGTDVVPFFGEYMKSDERAKTKINRKDVMFAGIVLFFALCIWGIMMIIQSKNGERVLIKIDGKIYEECSLSENKTIKIDNKYGMNVIVIKDKHVFAETADCPDKYCVNQGKISKSGQMIVCMPHKLVVEITGSKKKLDSVAR